MKSIKKIFLLMGLIISFQSLTVDKAYANKPVVYYDRYDLDEAVGLKAKKENNPPKEEIPSKDENENHEETNNTESQPEDNKLTEATITQVIDGDTVKVDIQGNSYKLRMIGVDTPETVHPNKPVQYFGKEASNFTKKNLTGKKVYLEKDVSTTDRYSRLLRYIWLEKPRSLKNPTIGEIESKMFNGILLRYGFAHAASFPPDVKYQDLFKQIEKKAEARGEGLWGEKSSENENIQDEQPNPKDDQKENPSDETNESGSSSSDSSSSHSSKKFDYPAGDRKIVNQLRRWTESRGKKYYADVTTGPIKANRNSGIYHTPGQKGYDKISVENVTWFTSQEAAIKAGYKHAKK